MASLKIAAALAVLCYPRHNSDDLQLAQMMQSALARQAPPVTAKPAAVRHAHKHAAQLS